MASPTKVLKSRKVKQIAFIAGVSLATVFTLNTLANRFAIARKAQQKIGTGI